ncbi:hypothetical protein A4A49_34760 [Nicotiana attenuata]|uniref:Uncharacterized protein n=1 Tax=Nicotiana attenuata TaxID=49451 RepID=A0A1J6K8P5_NICAT|nr:hypothetical protein A4A49_34760 [Nicotiana attenuata]
MCSLDKFILRSNGAQKLLDIVVVIAEALTYVLSWMYGSVSQLGVGNAILIILQLFLAAIILMCLDELLQEGYAFGFWNFLVHTYQYL